MKTGTLIIGVLLIATTVSATENTRLESNTNTDYNEATSQQQEQQTQQLTVEAISQLQEQQQMNGAINQQQVQVNTEMLNSFKEYQQTGSNAIITWRLLQGHSCDDVKGIVEDYNTIIKR